MRPGVSFGPAKMFVDSTLASDVIRALRARGEQLTANMVVVSRAFEHAVLDAALHQERTRTNYVVRQRPVDLSYFKGGEPVDLTRSQHLWLGNDNLQLGLPSPAYTVHRTFIELADGDRHSVVTRSDGVPERTLTLTAATRPASVAARRPRA